MAVKLTTHIDDKKSQMDKIVSTLSIPPSKQEKRTHQ